MDDYRFAGVAGIYPPITNGQAGKWESGPKDTRMASL